MLAKNTLSSTTDMSSISSHYRELTTPDEIMRVASETETAWQHPAIPGRQYEIVQPELEAFRMRQRAGQFNIVEPFCAFHRCLQQLSTNYLSSRDVRMLDVGASGGYYSDVAAMCGFHGQYTGFDFSLAFADFARGLYPGIQFDTGDARRLPYHDDWFEIVLSGGTLMHIYEWDKALSELVRVSSRYVILHRTPVAPKTLYWEKQAYGVKCLEIHFAEADLKWQFLQLGVQEIFHTDSFWHSELKHGMRTYLLEKPNSLRHVQV